jgi:redox-sensitive bicupin YhaK (pirin superfamily)
LRIKAYVVSGTLTLNGQKLETRDALGIWDTELVEISATSDAELLVMDIPME